MLLCGDLPLMKALPIISKQAVVLANVKYVSEDMLFTVKQKAL
jgi:hypothetical protein